MRLRGLYINTQPCFLVVHMSLVFLHVHVAYLTEIGMRCLTPDNAPIAMLYPPSHPEEEANRVLLLCLTGHLDRPFMERWTSALDSRFGCFWHDTPNICTCASLSLLGGGYLVLCFPTALVLIFLFQTHPIYFWLWHSSLVLLISFVLFRVYTFALYKLHYFSVVENQVAFNVNMQLATFFKQYPATRMKPYARVVPQFTMARLFLEAHQLTFTTLLYKPSTTEAVLIPSACEAVDALRAKRNSRRFVNMVIISTAGIPEHMQILYDFFIRSSLHAILSPDKSLLICIWTHSHTKFSIPIRQSAPAYQNHNLTMLPLMFTIQHDIVPTEAQADHIMATPVTAIPPLIMSPPHNRHYRAASRFRTFYRRVSDIFFFNPPTITPYQRFMDLSMHSTFP